MSRLATAVRAFVQKAKASPASAVGVELEELEKAAKRGDDGSFAAFNAPVAPYTWMVRGTLPVDQVEVDSTELRFGEEVELVGAQVVLVSSDANPALPVPPLSALDVQLKLNRKELYTAKLKQGPADGPEDFCSLASLDVAAPRLFRLLAAGSKDPILSMKFRWAIPLAIVGTRGWAKTQISVNFFVRTQPEGRCC
jgi:hypothetical protein